MWTLKLTYKEGDAVRTRVFVNAKYSFTSAMSWIEMYESDQWVGTYTGLVSIEPLLERGLTSAAEGVK